MAERDEERRDERITIRLTAEERELLEEAARKMRQPVSTWMAWAALRAARDGQ